MSTPQPPVVNLNPTQAVLAVSTQRITPSALRSEVVKGSEKAWFNIPHRLKALVNVYVSRPEYGFHGSHASFYVTAVAAYLQNAETLLNRSPERVSVVKNLEDLSHMLEYEEPCEDFRRRLEKAEGSAETCVRMRDWTWGSALLNQAILTASGAPGLLGESFSRDLRASRPMQALVSAMMADDGYGRRDDTHRLQKWMADA